MAVQDDSVRLAPERLVGWTGRLFPSAEGARLVFRGEGVELVQTSGKIDEHIVAGKRFELVGRGDKGLAGDRGDFCRHMFAKALRCVQACAYRRSALRQPGKGVFDDRLRPDAAEA